MVSPHEWFQFVVRENCLVLHRMQHNVPHSHSATDNAAHLNQLKLITWFQGEQMKHLKIWTLQSAKKNLLGHCRKLRDCTQEHLLRVSLCLPGSASQVDLFPVCLDHVISIEMSTYKKNVALWSLGCSVLHLSLELDKSTLRFLVCVTADNLGISQTRFSSMRVLAVASLRNPAKSGSSRSIIKSRQPCRHVGNAAAATLSARWLS